jgi:UDPglucose 6-dehydrogenase
VLAVMTEWNEFRLPDFKLMSAKIKLKTVFDGKNIYRTSKLSKYGLKHYGIGIEKFQLSK